ncbi:hypothetical protein EV424DRAFT_1360608 [Suillus variegatus]|nr:hypothetical protein EV424DRAFT_1360608 [Suillus variegatus]
MLMCTLFTASGWIHVSNTASHFKTYKKMASCITDFNAQLGHSDLKMTVVIKRERICSFNSSSSLTNSSGIGHSCVS